MNVKVTWAMGGKGTSNNLAHAYINDKALEEANCLCGRGVKPHLIFDSWDLDNKLILEHTCPQCLDRLNILKIAKEKKE